MHNLNTPLEYFADFLGLDFDLITAAAEESRDEGKLKPSSSEIVTWVRNLSQDEKDALLVRIIQDDISHHEGALRQRAFRDMQVKGPDAGNLTDKPPQRFSPAPTKLRRIGNEWRMSERNRNG